MARKPWTFTHLEISRPGQAQITSAWREVSLIPTGARESGVFAACEDGRRS